MMMIEIFNKNNDPMILTAAENLYEAAKEISKYKAIYSDITAEVDGKPFNTDSNPVDVRHIARNMRTERLENRILGDFDI